MIEFEDLDEDSDEDLDEDLGEDARAHLAARAELIRRTPSGGRPVTITRTWLVLALVGAALAGLLIGRWPGWSDSTAAPDANGSSAFSGPAPAEPDLQSPVVGEQLRQASQCASQAGKLLQVGIQVLNQTGQPAALSLIRVDLPLSGFTVVQAGFGACAEMANDGRDQIAVPPGGAVWVSALLRPTVRCIAPLPVRFRADVQTGRDSSTVTLGGYSDLGDVKWSGCPAQSSQFS